MHEILRLINENLISLLYVHRRLFNKNAKKEGQALLFSVITSCLRL